MFYIKVNSVRLLVVNEDDSIRLFSPNPLSLGNGLYVDKFNLRRDDLYKAMGYKTFDWAYPIDWARAQRKAGNGRWANDNTPQLVWSYDDGNFGCPVYDDDVIRALGNAIQSELVNGNVEFVNMDAIIFIDYQQAHTINFDVKHDLFSCYNPMSTYASS